MRPCQRLLFIFFPFSFLLTFQDPLATKRISLSSYAFQNLMFHNDVLATKNKFWYPSDDWIHDCVERQQAKNLHEPYNVQWIDYRLGDCIRMCRACDTSVNASSFGNYSIAGQYWLNACNQLKLSKWRSKNYTYVSELFDQYKLDPSPYSDPWEIPADDELVIHLRIGDVMDERWFLQRQNSTAFEMLRDGADTNHGKSSPYPHGIKSIRDYLDLIHQQELHKVVLRGGPHKPKAYPKSKVYTRCLAEAIMEAGFTVFADVKGEHTPDQDFFYMSHAKYFVPGTGGYSKIISQMVERLGGMIIDFPNESQQNQNQNPIFEDTN